MKLFFEGLKYDDNIFKHYFGDLPIKKGGYINGVGYTYLSNESSIPQEPLFILPKVFYKEESKDKVVLFGLPELEVLKNDAKPLSIDRDNLEIKIEEGSSIQFGAHEEWFKKVIYELPLLLYKAIRKYKQKKDDYEKQDDKIVKMDEEVDLLSSSKEVGEATLVDIAIALINFYKKHKDLIPLIYKEIHSGNNKINWSRTVRRHYPIIFDDEDIVYSSVCNYKKGINYDEQLIVIFLNTIKQITKEFALHYTVDCPFHLYSNSKFERMAENGQIIKLLKKIKTNYFRDDLITLWNLLYAYHQKIYDLKGNRFISDFLICKSFNNVFEDMIDELLSDNGTATINSLKNQKDGKIVDHLFKYESIIKSDDFSDIYYVGDSKYYKDGATPEGNSLYKQYTYVKNIIQSQIDWFNDEKDYKKYEPLKYKDDITDGYNISPNFFIMGTEEVEWWKDNAHLEREKDGEHFFSYQFKNRLFDRDTLFLQQYTINFIYVVNQYTSINRVDKERFKKHAKDQFKKDFSQKLNYRYYFFIIEPKNSNTVETLLNNHFRTLIGRVFCYETNSLILAIEKNVVLEDERREMGFNVLQEVMNEADLYFYEIGNDINLYHSGVQLNNDILDCLVEESINTY